MKVPKLSIITVVRNGEDTIKPTIESVITQTHTDYEYLIIDGKSSDNTMNVIQPYEEHISKIISEQDKGVYDGMNKGLALATGDYVLFLNAGDELASTDTLESLFHAKEGADLYYGETLIMTPGGKVIGTRTELTSRKLPSQLRKNDFLNGQVVSHQSFVPKRVLCPTFELRYKCSSDIDWMLKIVSKSGVIIKTDTSISRYLQGGISDRKLKTCWIERFQILTKHFNFFLVTFMHIKFAFRYLRIGSYKNTN